MNVIAVEPFYDKLQEYHVNNITDVEFWDWLKQEYGAYHVYLSSNYQAVGEKDGSGLYFGSPEEVTFFRLRWS
jgi:hypothetical protein